MIHSELNLTPLTEQNMGHLISFINNLYRQSPIIKQGYCTLQKIEFYSKSLFGNVLKRQREEQEKGTQTTQLSKIYMLNDRIAASISAVSLQIFAQHLFPEMGIVDYDIRSEYPGKRVSVICRLIIQPEHRSQGLSKLMLQQTIQNVFEMGYEFIIAFSINPRAIRALEFNGFKMTKKIKSVCQNKQSKECCLFVLTQESYQQSKKQRIQQ